MGYLIKMLIKKGTYCLLSFHGNLWGPEKGHGTFCGSTFHHQAAIDHVPPSGDAADLHFCPLSQFLGFLPLKESPRCNSFQGCMTKVQAFHGS